MKKVVFALIGIVLGTSAISAASAKEESVSGFKLVRTQEIKEINSTARLYEHEKTGARLIYLVSPDDNKVFSIAFRTPPADDTGLPHILEHSVLCGSRKFPSKEPFLELVKGSVKTFVNAMTYPDKTLYPVASRNDKDFRNLMDVYLDAVFFPNIHKDPLILKQEGWRYEMNEKTGDLEYNGVVFNEMKGVFSSPDSVLERKAYHALFPTGPYSFESGGEPKDIPSLTQDAFTAFHKKYYHPSNSLIMIYGNGNIEEHLKFLNDEYLSHFDRAKIDSEIALPKGKAKPVELTDSYSINPGDSPKDKAYLAMVFAAGESTDPEFALGMDILASILLQTEASPLKRALIEAGVGQDVSGDFDNGIKKPIFFIRAKKTNPEKKAVFKKVIESTLAGLVKKGIDKKIIEASLNRKEFALREQEYRGYPKGLVFNGMILDSWLYEGDPLVHLAFEPTLARIKAQAFNGYFEGLIKKHLIENPHRSLLVLKPEPGLDEKNSKKLADTLAKLKKGMKKDELQTILKVSADLKKKQQTPDSPEALAKIPLLEIKDLDPKAEVLPLRETEVGGVPFLFHDLPTSKIAYLNLLFDTSAVPEELIPYIGLLGEVLGKVNTEKYPFEALTNEINTYTGGLGFSPMPVARKDSLQTFAPIFRVRSKALLERLPKTYELIEEVLLRSKFEDIKRLREVVRESKAQYEQVIISSGHSFASLRLQSYFSKFGKYQDQISGLGYYTFLKDLDGAFDAKAGTAVENLKKVARLIFNSRQLRVSFTATEKDFVASTEGLKNFVRVFPSEELKRQDYKLPVSAANEGLIIPSKVQFVGLGGDFRSAGFDYSGSMLVLRNILSRDYLWNRVRVQGGAYGAFADIGRSGQFIFSSFRDPNLNETFDAYQRSVEFLRGFNASDREMTKFVLGTVSGLDMPLTPSQKGETATIYWLMGLSQKEIQKARDEVLATRQKNIRDLTPVVEAVLKQKNVAVIGSDKKIEANKERFGSLVQVLK